MAKKTAWFPGYVRPARVGVYQTGDSDDLNFQHWNGTWWGMLGVSADNALEFADDVSVFQSLPWRGLTQNPEAA